MTIAYKKTAIFIFFVIIILAYLYNYNHTCKPIKKYYKNQYLVLFSEHIHNKEEILQKFDLQITQNLGEWVLANKKNSKSYVDDLDENNAKLEEILLQKLQEHPFIHSASLNFLQITQDSCTFCQKDSINLDDETPWHLSKEYGINIKEAWDISKGDKNNVLAIVDRNFIFPQKILCQTKSYYYQNILDFISTKAIDDDHTPHGLEILSVLGCNTDLKTSIMAIDSQSDRSLSTRMLGVLWAAGLSKKDLIKNIKPNPHPAKVINASFGFLFSDLKNPPFGPVLDTISALNDHNAILVCSAGNESTLADNRLPGSLAGVISVGASNKNQQSAYFSNFGKSVDILAPGEDILGFSKNLEPIMLDGTSFAAPITASIISLLVSINPNFSWKHVEYLLKNSAKTISCADYCPSTMPINSQKLCQKTCCDKNNNNICDLGIINAYNALSLAKKELFNKVLLDVDDYFLPLDPSNNFSKTISVKNWGFSSGLVKFYTKEPFIYAYPDEFYINAAKDFNSPAIQKVTLYSATPEFAKKFTIKFISKNDNIEAMVSLDPL